MHRRLRVSRDARRPAPHRNAARHDAADSAAARQRRRQRLPQLRTTADDLGLARAGAGAAACCLPWPLRRGISGALALLCPAVLIWLWSRAPSAREGAWLGFAFGFGTYAAGTWWLYIAIRVFGQAPVWVALVVMAALVLIMAAYQAALGYVVVRWLPVRRAQRAGCCWCRRPGCCWSGGAAGSFPDFRGCRWAIRRPIPGWRASRRWAACTCSAQLLLIGAGALVTLRAASAARGCARWHWWRWCCRGSLGLSLRDVEWTHAEGATAIGRHPAGRRAAGHEMAGVQPAENPR